MEPDDTSSWRSRTRRIAAGVILGLVAVAIGWLLTPTEPELVRGLEGGWDARNAELIRRVASRFPAGTPVAGARKTLLEQGFTVSDGEAKWDRNNHPCRIFVTIRWQARGDAIAATSATIFEACS